jgi:hypothetical protein
MTRIRQNKNEGGLVTWRKGLGIFREAQKSLSNCFYAGGDCYPLRSRVLPKTGNYTESKLPLKNLFGRSFVVAPNPISL